MPSPKEDETVIVPTISDTTEQNWPYKVLSSKLVTKTFAIHTIEVNTSQGPKVVALPCEDTDAMRLMQNTANEIVKNCGAP